jgi:hypothetical protein
MAYELLVAEKDEIRFCFRLDGDAAKRCGAIGYLRADFGRGGKEFYTTWFDNQAHLKCPDFKHQFDELINSLRDDGQKPPFASRSNHLDFCAAHPPMTCFKVATLDYSYYFRLNPQQGTYDIYCFAYDNRYLLPERAGGHELPERCFCIKPSDGQLIVVQRGESGYIATDYQESPQILRALKNEMNQRIGVTPRMEAAMLSGSLFGWDTPAAKPWNYNQDGTARPLPPKEKDRDYER